MFSYRKIRHRKNKSYNDIPMQEMQRIRVHRNMPRKRHRNKERRIYIRRSEKLHKLRTVLGGPLRQVRQLLNKNRKILLRHKRPNNNNRPIVQEQIRRSTTNLAWGDHLDCQIICHISDVFEKTKQNIFTQK